MKKIWNYFNEEPMRLVVFAAAIIALIAFYGLIIDPTYACCCK